MGFTTGSTGSTGKYFGKIIPLLYFPRDPRVPRGLSFFIPS